MSIDLRETVTDPKTGNSRTGNVFEAELAVKTTGFSDVMESRAVLEGELTTFASDAFNESEVDLLFYYGEKGNPVDKNEVDAGSLSSTGSFSIPVEGLSGETTYQFQAAGRVDNEERTGSVKQLTTGLLTVTTDAATKITDSSLRFNGTLSEISGVKATDVTASIDFREAGTQSFTTVSAGSASSPGDTFFVEATGLDSNTDYEFKAKVEGLGETEDGSLKTATTALSEDVDLNTLSAVNVGAEDATLDGEITKLQAISSVDYRFDWGLQGNMSNSTATKSASSVGNVNEVISNLDAGTTYEYELIAESQEATYKGGPVTFTTNAAAVSTATASGIKSGSATLNGTLDALDESLSSANVSLEYRIAGTSGTFTELDAGTLSSTGSFSASISAGALSENTEFEFRAVAEVDGSTFKGALQTFTTLDQTVQVNTNTPQKIEATEAELNGNSTTFDNVESGDRFFEYGISSVTEAETLKNPAQIGTYSSVASGLDPGETYQFRAAVETLQTKTTGSVVFFTTKALAVNSDGAVASAGGATLTGTLEALASGGDADVEFEYGKQGNNLQQSTGVQNLSSPGSFSEVLNNLDPGTTYEFRATGTETASTDTDDGEVLTFSTDNLEVSTNGTLETNVGSITFEGVLDENESGNPVSVSFEYQKVSESGFNNSLSAGGQTSPGTFFAEATGLEEDTLYEFRAVAEQGGGTAKGSLQSTSTENVDVGNGTVTDTSTSGFDVEFDIATFTGVENITAGIDYVASSNGDFANGTRVEDSDNPHTSEKTLEVSVSGLDSGTDYDWRPFLEVDGVRVEGSTYTASTEGIAVSTVGTAEIKGTNAKFEGSLDFLESGEDAYTSFQWGLAGNVQANSTSAQTLSSPGAFFSQVDSLSTSTSYDFRATATTTGSGETDVGQVIGFETKALQVIADFPTNIGVGSAQLNGTLEALDSAENDVTAEFEWGEGSSETDLTNTISAGTLTSAGPFNAELTGLSKDTQYIFRPKATANPSGDTLDTELNSLTFTTENIEITDGIVSNTTSSSFTVEFDVSTFTGSGDITLGIDYVASSDGDFANSTRVEDAENPASATGTFDVTADGLSSGTDYDWRAFAEVDGVRVEGAVGTATTA